MTHSRSGEFLLCESIQAQSLPGELTELQNMNQVLVWASHEFSVSGHKLSSVKRLGKEIMRGLEYIISKINMLEKIHFDDSHSLKTMHCFIRISK